MVSVTDYKNLDISLSLQFTHNCMLKASFAYDSAKDGIYAIVKYYEPNYEHYIVLLIYFNRAVTIIKYSSLTFQAQNFHSSKINDIDACMISTEKCSLLHTGMIQSGWM